jgi:hypothetical protein
MKITAVCFSGRTGAVRAANKGSLLIVALILSAVIGLSLASYLNVGRSSLAMSNRALYNNAAMNLAENGLEEAMYAINQFRTNNAWGWSGWSDDGGGADKKRKWTAASDEFLKFDQNATGEVNVYIYSYASNPKVVVRAAVSLAGKEAAAPVEKWIEVQLRRTSKFANGLVAKDSIKFSGNNASVDSWNSLYENDGSPRASAVAYSSTTKKDNGSVGSISVSVDAVLVQNADIWGYANTGGALPKVGSQGLVGPFGTKSGEMDMSRVSTDFSANFDAIETPTASYTTLGNITNNLNLPRAGDTPIGGVYYYEAGQISFNNRTLAIKKVSASDPDPKVVIKLTNTSTSIDIGGGSGELRIDPAASLEIYAPGDIKVAGNGVMNGGTTASTANLPMNFQIWGTKTTGVQNIQIAGNGALSGTVYAPQGSVKVNGNGDVMGSIVANDITLVGNAAFHYDEALGMMGGNDPYRVTKWNELTSASERAPFAAKLTF